MSTVSGVVTSKSRSGKGIQIDKEKWYNAKTADILASVNWKDTVTITVDDDGTVLSVDKVGAPKSASAGGSGYKYDPDTERGIEMRACRRDAITLIMELIQQGAFPMPKDNAAKLDAVLDMLDYVQDRFFLHPFPKEDE